MGPGKDPISNDKNMTVLKAVVLLREQRSDGKVNIKIRITHMRKTLYLSTNQYIHPEFFDNKSGTIKPNHPNYDYLNPQIRSKILQCERVLIKTYGDRRDYTAQDIKRVLRAKELGDGVIKYMERLIESMKKSGNNGNADVYSLVKNKLNEYIGEIPFEAINYEFLKGFESHMMEEGLSHNTISMYLRTLRAVFNRAIDSDVVSQDIYPFRKYKIKPSKPNKRNLPAGVISQIANCKLRKKTEFARDFFMLSFYLIGMNVIDLYNLKQNNYFGGRIDYTRQKTGEDISVKVRPEAEKLIEKYRSDKDYLLKFHYQYFNHKNLTKYVNKALKDMAGELSISRPVSTYYARHSWATIAISLGYSRDIIGKALGHSDRSVTAGYIDYDPAIIDNVNKAVIEHIKVKNT